MSALVFWLCLIAFVGLCAFVVIMASLTLSSYRQPPTRRWPIHTPLFPNGEARAADFPSAALRSSKSQRKPRRFLSLLCEH